MIFLSVYSVHQVRCGHIVGFATLNWVSHHRVLWTLGKKLQNRGHKYTHILPSFAKETYDDVDLKTFNSSLTSQRIEGWFQRLASLNGDYTKDIFALLELIRIAPQRVQLLGEFCEEQRVQLLGEFCEDFFQHESLIIELTASVDLVLCDVVNHQSWVQDQKVIGAMPFNSPLTSKNTEGWFLHFTSLKADYTKDVVALLEVLTKII